MFKKFFRKCALEAISTQSIQQRIYNKNTFHGKNIIEDLPEKVKYLDPSIIRWFIAGMLVLNIILLTIIFFKSYSIKDYDINPAETFFPFTVQAAVYSSFDRANLVVYNLKEKGFESASICKPLGSKSDYYRVYVGQFESIKDAEKVKTEIDKFFNFQNSIVRRRL